MDQLESHKNLLSRLDSINIKDNTQNILSETDDIKQQINEVFISEIKIIGIRKTTKPNTICINEQSYSIEKMSIPLKINAVKIPTNNFISHLHFKIVGYFSNSESIQHHHFEQLV